MSTSLDRIARIVQWHCVVTEALRVQEAGREAQIHLDPERALTELSEQ